MTTIICDVCGKDIDKTRYVSNPVIQINLLNGLTIQARPFSLFKDKEKIYASVDICKDCVDNFHEKKEKLHEETKPTELSITPVNELGNE